MKCLFKNRYGSWGGGGGANFYVSSKMAAICVLNSLNRINYRHGLLLAHVTK